MSSAPRSWPAELRVGVAGRLELEGCDLEAVARSHGTPLWVTSRAAIERSFRSLSDAFRRRWSRCELAYAMKCNNTLAVVRILHGCGALVDASAEYEVQLALAAGVPAHDIILNGNGKSNLALELAARLGVRQVNVDSLGEIERLEAVAARVGRRVPCLLRIQLTYEDLLAEDPSFESTLRIGEGKFGVALRSGEARAAVDMIQRAASLEFLGLHHHVGFSGYMGDYSPERELMHHSACTREICRFANELHRDGVRVVRLDLGGGFRVGGEVVLSTPGGGLDPVAHPLPGPDDYADAIFSVIEHELDSTEPPLVQFESGGGQVGNATLLLVQVVEVKRRSSGSPEQYVVVDGSMMMFVSRGMMRVGYPLVHVTCAQYDPAPITTDVVGQTCVYDSIAEGIVLPSVEPGELLAVLHQGAYCETESTQFNGFPRPESVLVDRGAVSTVRRRETLGDIGSRDVIPPALWTG